LFDHFPDGSRVLGGAPFNVAWHLQALGEKPYFISRVGRDAEGDGVRDAMAGWGMDTGGLQTDPGRATGLVRVSIVGGEPRYEIVEDCAYDAIEAPELTGCGLLYHGSLAARASRSAETLRHLRRIEPEAVFIDVNLRPPWWRKSQLQALLDGAHWIKLNQDELVELQGDGRSPAAVRGLLERCHSRGVILTRGAQGAELVLAEGGHLAVEAETGVEVADTVGAGDAFASIVVLGLVRKWPMPVTLHRAQQFAGRVVGRRGATVRDREFYAEFVSEWGLDA